MMMDDEVWKYVPGYEGKYAVSNHGNVKSLTRVLPDGRVRKGRYLKPYKDKDGYLRVTLAKDLKGKHYFIHRLVAQAFIPNEKKLPQINHKDETKTNNIVDNLEWCDARYNLMYGTHIEKISLKIRGENSCHSKLTEADVKEIRNSYIPFDKEYGQCALSRKYGMSQSTIGSIVNGKLWRHLLQERENK